ncbi:MAG: hypothetical protein QM621_08590 [Aeromicrobium sp.]|uniref:DUF6777 domain-containing protein n=1 Tax=Aeromicrobium sp. TaxID=1871063 RepID=UPI0039E4ED72
MMTTRERWTRRAAAALTVVALTATAACGSDSGGGGGGDSDPVILEALDSTGDAPFTDSVAGDVALSDEAAAVADDAGHSGQVDGTTPGLYGGTNDNAACDQAALAEFLSSDDEKAEAWAEVAGVEAGEVGDYLAALTPVVLTRDTAVINHGFENGKATPFPAILQAGSAVLVDANGTPRVRCACGNPLTVPEDDLDVADTEGDEWDGYDPKSVIGVTPAPEPVDELTLIDPTTGETIQRPTGPIPTPPVDGAYPWAGGPIPEWSQPATVIKPAQESYESDEALVTTPTLNISCRFSARHGQCGVSSWWETLPYGEDEHAGPNTDVRWPDEGQGVPVVGTSGGAPGRPDPAAQVLQYGQVAHFGDYVCASEENGLTCWNAATGHGAFINRDGFAAF